ncbi:hypothetical protein [Nodosilinea sp. P-1105]|uniref:hypothetical protein n=1 Tax=Nodosilinea sp. P-1105 TaxID=2546229 RepID=UPI00146F93F2|nr:hypothetical protein [Nodosilinea sp. P-1105]NMF82202.1 hypothetical protein [Nodosilinea sp. P-1105]
MADKIIPRALKIWLGFLFVFLLLDYGIIPSIGFSAIAGIAGGTIGAWWITPGGEPRNLDLPEPIRRFGRQIRQTPNWLPFRQSIGRNQGQRYSRPRR